MGLLYLYLYYLEVSANKDLENVRRRRVISGWPTLYRKEKRTKHFDLKISVEATACQTWTLVEGYL